MASDDVWILGIHMTKFGKHPDKDVVDIGAEAATAALADAGVTMGDMGVLAAGNLLNAAAGFGRQPRSRSARPASPSTTSPTPVPRSTALRTAIMAVKAGECDMGLAVGVENSRRGPAGRWWSTKEDKNTWEPKGRYGAVAPVDGRIGTETMPSVSAQVGME